MPHDLQRRLIIMFDSPSKLDEAMLPHLPDLATRLKWARIRAKLTQAQLAERIGVEREAISQIERGLITKPRKIMEIGKEVNAPPAWLMFGRADIDDLSTESLDFAVRLETLTPNQKKALKNLLDSFTEEGE